MNAEWKGLCEGEIVTCFWNSTLAVTESSGSQIVLPRVKTKVLQELCEYIS